MPTSHAPQPSPSRMVGFAGHSAAVGVVAFADVVFTATWSGSLGGPMAWVPLGDEASQRAGELLCHGERCPGADLAEREEISRGMAERVAVRVVAARLGSCAVDGQP